MGPEKNSELIFNCTQAMTVDTKGSASEYCLNLTRIHRERKVQKNIHRYRGCAKGIQSCLSC
jgi:hypothetical protein